MVEIEFQSVLQIQDGSAPPTMLSNLKINILSIFVNSGMFGSGMVCLHVIGNSLGSVLSNLNKITKVWYFKFENI